MMRRRIEQPSCILTIENGGVLGMTQDTYDYISKLKLKIKELENEKHSIEEELKAIKPILEHKNYQPAISKECDECKFAVHSKWSGAIIGCRKNAVCDDFIQKD